MTAGVFLNVSVLPSEAVALCNLELTYLARLAGLGSPDSLPPQCRRSNSGLFAGLPVILAVFLERMLRTGGVLGHCLKLL